MRERGKKGKMKNGRESNNNEMFGQAFSSSHTHSFSLSVSVSFSSRLVSSMSFCYIKQINQIQTIIKKQEPANTDGIGCGCEQEEEKRKRRFWDKERLAGRTESE